MSTTQILKELYPMHSLAGGPVMERSWAAKLARDRHWITWAQYFEYPIEDTGRRVESMSGLVYASSPFYGLIKSEPWSR